ncbi:FUSC family protein [Yersinia intermedia]|uniref:FUSC family protein n=1 Tax=Yersinia intermedia TaxID=631 RepID=UPI0005E1E6B3|nr:FUSC family protein [Yersinia intermedia]CND48146.1 Uncharacterised protein [Yersinia intermedia]
MEEIDWRECSQAIIIISPWIILSQITTDPLWLHAGMVGISCYIAAKRAELTLLGCVLHLLTLLVVYLLLFSLLHQPLLFSFTCGVFAACIIYLTQDNRPLRSAANFIFIPALYLAWEQSEQLHSGIFGLETGLMLIPYLLVGGVSTILLFIIILLTQTRGVTVTVSSLLISRSLREQAKPQQSESMPFPGLLTIIAGVSVTFSSMLAEYLKLPHSQWIIWSALSIIIGDTVTCWHKFFQRGVGVFMGVPMGIIFSLFIPDTPLIQGGLALGIMLSLVMFPRYLIGFSVRCTLISLSITLASHNAEMAAERIINVFLGGSIALIVMVFIRFLFFQWQLLRQK